MNIGARIDKFFNNIFGEEAKTRRAIKRAIGRNEYKFSDEASIQKWYDRPYFRLCDVIQPYTVPLGDKFATDDAKYRFNYEIEKLRAFVDSEMEKGNKVDLNRVYHFSWSTGMVFRIDNYGVE